MNKDEQQKELENIIIKNTERYVDYDEEYPFESRREAEPDRLAKKILKAGYHKTVWHKVIDGDLPPANTDIIFYAYMISGNCYYDLGVYSHIEKLWYGNICSTTNDRVIAWMDLQEYEE
jgi:hypothetical protein